MERALIISLHFHPGHVSHMVASYRQLEELGYEPAYCVDETFLPYLPENSRILVYGKDKIGKVALGLFVFPSHKNLFLARALKRKRAKILYVFHEPLAPMKEYRRVGFPYRYLAKLWVINQISSLTVKWCDAVLLPSKKAVEFYRANPLYKNEHAYYLPLLYSDERTSDSLSGKRLYFAYIGTVAPDHKFNEFFRFVEWAVRENRLPELKFLIATKSEFDVPQILVDSPRVVIRKGKPLKDKEINECFASTFVVWNAYARTTQSGVLAKSFMFGTPAIVLRKNLSEFMAEGQEVVAIEDNTSFEQIETAIRTILDNFEHYSVSARDRFEKMFYYRQYNERFKEILSSL